MSLLISREMKENLLNKYLKDITFGCGNMTLIFNDNTKLYIKSKQLEVEVEYWKKEKLIQILD